ncbi:hypothetical protein ABB37_02634 [Leptomonas pyrrhocoris]|uniref:Uncharacterized protein n=1 Tax=Leptomonas pyrrhocoris TaxID=157538 RepID=A0A0M9G5J3_LEPPY|nr:hypothetical protein ABB37_02634 [Leptomonas pyrrhocoris]KPA82870.1 hypothetical protein ABB37_02634 [Leptomonas pyrrhocoris]|eukprot:XP_015661309.1 hypothetical protein ABB37_02634 [Leptomonas pyrrhocoris]
MAASGAMSGTPPPSCSPPPPACLSVWVIGNPTSGGKRGAIVLGRLAKLFQRTYGAEAVQELHSSRFLSLAFPPHPTPSSAARNGDAMPSTDVFSQLPSLDAIWASGAAASTAVAGPTPPITPPSSPPNATIPPPPSSSSPSSSARVRTMLIHTDQGGHAKPVSNALSRLILRSRLTDQQQQQETPLNGATTTGSSSAPYSPPLWQHLVLVAGGDGTLSEVVNGLCEGTLAGYKHFTSALHGCTSVGAKKCVGCTAAAHSSHAHVEQEAAVFTRLLPAVLYVPGGTGADFAKLRLCCSTPEAALHVVRDGVAKMLFESSRRMRTTTTATNSSAATLPESKAACYACPVDIGRIEFLNTGTRHFFLNIASIGMSCDVIQRGERFKHSRFISKLGGTLMFALSSLISLFLMTPKPLLLCKLPPRTTRAAAAVAIVGAEVSSEDIITSKAAEARNGHVCSGSHTNRQAGEEQQFQQWHSAEEAPPPKGSLLSLPSFSPLGEQLRRLQAELPLHAGHESVAQLHSLVNAPLFSSLHGDSIYAPTKEENAYGCHVGAPIPAPHAKIVQCMSHTSSRYVHQLLDINEQELLALRHQQALQLERMMTTSFDTATEEREEKPHQAVSARERAHPGNHYAIHAMNNGTNGGHYGNGTLQPLTAAALAEPRKEWISTVNGNDDDLAALTWVELPSSMVAFANGRWYGGGMHVAPHADPTDGMLSCTSWVATVLPFISGALSLYTGRHLHWSSTSAFEGERFLVSSGPSKDADVAVAPVFMEADGEVLEPLPAIVELTGKITFLVPCSSHLCLGDPAPGTTRAGLTAAADSQPSTTQFFFADKTTRASVMSERLRRSFGGISALWRRLWSYAQRRLERDGRSCSGNAKYDRDGVSVATRIGSAGATCRSRDGCTNDIV